MTIRTIDQLPVDGRRVLLRLDLNVPLDSERAVVDDSRILAAVPTIQHLIEREARIIVASHLGRPDGERLPEFSLEPVAARLAELLDGEVILSEESVGDGPRKMAFALREGQLLMLENLRFYPGESANDEIFAKRLASLADVYVNDAFGTMHRSHASIVGVARYLKSKGIGPLVQKEMASLRRLLDKPDRPFVAIIGGAKVRDKIELLQSLIGHADVLCIGGAMAFTFLAAKGVSLGRSRVELDLVTLADKLLRRAAGHGTRIVLPIDHMAVPELGSDAAPAHFENRKFPAELMAVDIGPATAELFQKQMEGAATVFWNGPVGVFETPPFNRGTELVGKAVARSNAFSVVGGGDSVSALRRGGLAPFITHVSTGGGASLKFLEGSRLPGLAALQQDGE